MGSPAPVRCWPPIVMVRSAPSPASSLILFSTAARSGLPGTYWRTGSLAGCGTWVTASMGGPPALLPVIVDGHSMVTRGGHRSHRRGHGEQSAQSRKAVSADPVAAARLAYKVASNAIANDPDSRSAILNSVLASGIRLSPIPA